MFIYSVKYNIVIRILWSEDLWLKQMALHHHFIVQSYFVNAQPVCWSSTGVCYYKTKKNAFCLLERQNVASKYRKLAVRLQAILHRSNIFPCDAFDYCLVTLLPQLRSVLLSSHFAVRLNVNPPHSLLWNFWCMVNRIWHILLTEPWIKGSEALPDCPHRWYHTNNSFTNIINTERKQQNIKRIEQQNHIWIQHHFSALES